MKPDHEAALAKCRAWPHKSNTAACYLDAMTRLDKAAELLARSLDVLEEANIWGTLNDDIRAFLDERKTDDKQS